VVNTAYPRTSKGLLQPLSLNLWNRSIHMTKDMRTVFELFCSW